MISTEQDEAVIQDTLAAESFPLSWGQQSLWFMEQLHPGSPAYNIPEAWRISGQVNVGALQNALNGVVERHETLRTAFVNQDGKPMQVVNPTANWPLEVKDLRGEFLEDSEFQAQLRAEASRAFDLAAPPLARAILFLLADQDSVLLLNVHHLISDAWSFGVLRRELSELYAVETNGKRTSLPVVPVQFVDFVLWQRDPVREPLFASQREFWKRTLGDLSSRTALLPDKVPPAQRSLAGQTLFHYLPETLAVQLRELARRQNGTIYTILLSALSVLLHRYTREQEVTIGSPFSGRERAEVEGLIGFFVNTHALRAQVTPGATFSALLQRVKATVFAAQENQELPLKEVVEAIGGAGQRGHSLFQIVLGMENEVTNQPLFPGTECTLIEVDTQTAKFDLTVLAAVLSRGIRLRFEFSTELFEEKTIWRIARQYEHLLNQICADPDRSVADYELATADERALVLGWEQGGAGADEGSTVVELFEKAAKNHAESDALTQGDKSISYRELNGQANYMAARLRALGVLGGDRVGVCLGRSFGSIISLLGVLKTGAAYVPLDPSYPLERLRFMAQDTALRGIITDAEGASALECIGAPLLRIEELSGGTAENPGTRISEEDLAYIMFTSGSTGQPKGVAVPHRGIVRLVRQPNYLDISSEDVFLQLAPGSFDASTLEIWGALLNGARLVLPPAEMLTLHEIGRIIESEGVSVLWLTAGLFHQAIDLGIHQLCGLKYLLAGGDELSVAHILKARQNLPATTLINGYGPTENTTFTCCYPVPETWRARKSVPIGRPISGTSVQIVDPEMRPVAIGVPGELYTGGRGLALGYWNRPDLTAERFIADPRQPGFKLYRTGDLARWNDDGTIEFLGRMDQQVKIRGFRVEPGEIEAALKSHPQVKECVVQVRVAPDDCKHLVAYYTPASEFAPGEESLRDYLVQRLPSYMIPAFLVALEALPLNANGKIDRASLPDPSPAGLEEFEPPRTETEAALARIFQEVLGLNNIGIRSNFFRLGGHSLSATQIMARITRDFEVELPLHVLFENPTVAGLAIRIDACDRQQPEAILPTLDADRAAALLSKLDELTEEQINELMEQLRIRDLLT